MCEEPSSVLDLKEVKVLLCGYVICAVPETEPCLFAWWEDA